MKIIGLLITLILLSPSAHAIKKCKDADGKIHYGDVAVAECENSKVTTLSDRGFIKEELDAPKTDEELQTEAEEAALIEREIAEKQAREDEKRRILSIYETEDDIDRQRDNQVRSVQSNIDVHQAYLKSMDTRIARYESKLQATDNKTLKRQLEEKIADAEVRIKEYKSQLAVLEEQKAEILQKFKQERETYLSLKNND